MSGLSEAELAKRAEQLVDVKTGRIDALSALDAALVAVSGGGQKATVDSFNALAAATASPHVIEEPSHQYTHGTPKAGFAPEPPQPPSIGGPAATLEKAGKAGASKMSGFCGGISQPPPPPAPPPPEPAKPQPFSPETPNAPTPQAAPLTQDVSSAPVAATPTPARPTATSTGPSRRGFIDSSAGGSAPKAGSSGPSKADIAAAQGSVDSTNIQFEMIKMQVQKMAEVQNAMTNVLAAMQEQAMTAIRNSKA
jgi:hypothetical protein